MHHLGGSGFEIAKGGQNTFKGGGGGGGGGGGHLASNANPPYQYLWEEKV